MPHAIAGCRKRVSVPNFPDISAAGQDRGRPRGVGPEARTGIRFREVGLGPEGTLPTRGFKEDRRAIRPEQDRVRERDL